MSDATHEKALSAIHDDPHGTDWQPDVHDHVGRCAACQRTMRALRSFVGSMRRRQEKVAPPPELIAQVCRTVQAEQNKTTRRRATIVRLAIPAALAAGLAIGFLWPNPPAPGVVDVTGPDVATLLDDAIHDRLLLDGSRSGVEYASADASEASGWLSQNLGFDVTLPTTAPDGWRLEGTRIWHTAGAMSALATYTDGLQQITVFARPASGLEVVMPTDAPVGSTISWRMETADHRGVAWVDDGLAWVAVGTGPIEDVAAWVETYRAR